MSDQRLGPLVGEWLRESSVPTTDPREGVRHVVAQTSDMSQVGTGWLSRVMGDEVVPVPVPTTNGRTRPRGFTMFSAVKFVAAAAIVALFGGFLLAGVLTTPQEGEVLPAAVTESPSPMTTEALLSGMVTEEVEPGVFRVVNDGVRGLSFPVGEGWAHSGHTVDVAPDGTVWLSVDEGGHGLFRLGQEPVFEDIEGFPRHREVAPDGSLWAIGEVPDDSLWATRDDRWGIFTFGRPYPERWTLRLTTGDGLSALAVGPDGTVWVAAIDPRKHCPDIEDEDCYGTVLLRLEGDGSLTTIEDWSDVYAGDASWHELAVSPDGDAWLIGGSDDPQVAGVLLRFDGERWEAIPGPEGWAPGEMGRSLAIGPDGTLWVDHDELKGGLARYDDAGWTTFTETDGVEPWSDQAWAWAWAWAPRDVPTVAADGSLWLQGLGTDDGCGGAAHFDGTTWTSYLGDSCIHDLAIAPDGSVWLRAYAYVYDSDNDRGISGPLDLYVITPETVAGTE